MIEEKDVVRLSDDIKYLKKWIKTYGIPSELNSSTGLKFLEELIDIKKQKIEEWQAPPTEKSCDGICPRCGAFEKPLNSFRTGFECGSSIFDGRISSFIQSKKCKELDPIYGSTKQLRPMTAIEIAQFIAKTGYVLCEIQGCDIQLFADIYIISGDEQSYEDYRYLKPDSDKLYKFDEVSE